MSAEVRRPVQMMCMSSGTPQGSEGLLCWCWRCSRRWVPAGIAQAQATVFRFETQEPLPDSTALPECLTPDLIGTQTDTETTIGQVTDTGHTFQVDGTTTLDYRVVFPDGRYVVPEPRWSTSPSS